MYRAAASAKVVAVVTALVIGVVLAYGVLRVVAEEHKQTCIEEAQARFPAVGLAYSGGSGGGGGGPDHISNVQERDAALDSCKATIF